jgi:methionyl-tRNA formyltransferase
LKACLDLPDVHVVGVVTALREFAISYSPDGVRNVLHADIAGLANDLFLPVQTIKRGMNDDGLFETVQNWNPDVFLVVGWYHMVPRRWRELAPAFGLHASLLPNYRGGAPLVWAMIEGETQTGITMFQMDDGVDSGPIAGQKQEPILSDDTIATLYARIEERGLELLRESLPQLANGTLELSIQDESLRRVMPQRLPRNGEIDWHWDSAKIDRFIRAQTRPYPGAFSTWKGHPLHIWQARVGANNSPGIEAGLVIRLPNGAYAVGCGTGNIILDEVSFQQTAYDKVQLAELFGDGLQYMVSCPSSTIMVEIPDR